MNRRAPVLRAVAAFGFAALGLLALHAPGSDAFIYWGDSQNQRIGRANNDGSGVDNDFIRTGKLPSAVAVDSSHIYWANQAGDSIGRARIDGSGVENDFLTGVGEPTGVAVNASSVFWSTLGGPIGRASIDGSEKDNSFIVAPEFSCGVALDAGHVYWADNASPAYIGRASLNGADAKADFVAIPGNNSPCGIAVDASNVFWADFGLFGLGTSLGGANKITGEDADASIIGDAKGPCGVAVFGSRLYWANAQTNTIGRANTDTTAVDQSFVATGGSQICGVAVDSLAPPPPPAPAGGGDAPPHDAPPQTTIVKGPGGKLAKRIAKFRFRSSEPGSTFLCRLDKRKPARCKSPRTYKRLKPGRHVFRVWAIDAAGNKDPTPARRRFRVPR